MESKDRENPIHLESNSEEKMDFYIAPILPYVSENHLDIGCGEGSIINRISNRKRNSKITGFDIDKEVIELAQKKPVNKHLDLTSDINYLKDRTFESASSIFTLHEAGKELFKTASDKLKSGGILTIVDYNLIKDSGEENSKNLNDRFYSLEEFVNIFSSTEREVEELAELGPHQAYRLHTRFNMKSCQRIAEESGFKTIDSKKLNQKYFFWVGSRE